MISMKTILASHSQGPGFCQKSCVDICFDAVPTSSWREWFGFLGHWMSLVNQKNHGSQLSGFHASMSRIWWPGPQVARYFESSSSSAVRFKKTQGMASGSRWPRNINKDSIGVSMLQWHAADLYVFTVIHMLINSMHHYASIQVVPGNVSRMAESTWFTELEVEWTRPWIAEVLFFDLVTSASVSPLGMAQFSGIWEAWATEKFTLGSLMIIHSNCITHRIRVL